MGKWYTGRCDFNVKALRRVTSLCGLDVPELSRFRATRWIERVARDPLRSNPMVWAMIAQHIDLNRCNRGQQ